MQGDCARRRPARVADQAVDARLNLNEGREPQVYSLGIKELWELRMIVISGARHAHLGLSVGPLSIRWRLDLRNAESHLNIGYVTGLDYRDPLLDPHAEFQRFKQHPYFAKLLEGGKMIRYGAKTIAPVDHSRCRRFTPTAYCWLATVRVFSIRSA